MRTYAQFSPSGFDRAGIGLPDRQSWLVAPVSQTRDSGPLDTSNFAVFLRSVGGESATVEIHRFGHWAPGWFEIILLDPTDTARIAEAEDMEASLADYPVLDESDYSEREWTQALDWWRAMGLRCRMDVCRRFGHSVFAARRDDELPRNDDGALLQYLTSN